MSESIVEGMKRSVVDPRDMSDGFMVTQTLGDAMIQYKNKNKQKASALLHQIFTFSTLRAYADVCDTLGFDHYQHTMATVSLSDFVELQIADSFVAMDNAHRACSSLDRAAVAALYIMALVQNVEYDLTVFLDNESEAWPLEDDGDDE
jgi:hypothetical protein